MFAFQVRKENLLHGLLIVAFLLNMLTPNSVSAMSSKAEQANTVSASSLGRLGRVDASFRNSTRSARTELMDVTPEASPTETVVVNPTETSTVEPTLPATLEVTPTLSPTPEATLTPTPSQPATQTVTPVTAPATQSPSLFFSLSASPEQAAPGDVVTYTVTIVNQGKDPVTNPVFSNRLPDQFGQGQNGFKGFQFDPTTRLLTWDGTDGKGNKPSTKPIVQPGDTLTLQYTVHVDAQLDEVQLSDSATFTADGLPQPILAKSLLTILAPQKHLNIVDAKGGKAIGLNGHLKLNLPQNAVNKVGGVLISDISDNGTSGTALPSFKFKLPRD